MFFRIVMLIVLIVWGYYILYGIYLFIKSKFK